MKAIIKLERFPFQDLCPFLQAADKKVVDLESTRDLSRIWMHVDMDAFYASVEELHDPSLADKPMAVGGMGMICTANYEVSASSTEAITIGKITYRFLVQTLMRRHLVNGWNPKQDSGAWNRCQATQSLTANLRSPSESSGV